MKARNVFLGTVGKGKRQHMRFEFDPFTLCGLGPFLEEKYGHPMFVTCANCKREYERSKDWYDAKEATK